ncbi:MAG: hypothetical protein AB7N71_07970 [Phycisphaerae bacterium]
MKMTTGRAIKLAVLGGMLFQVGAFFSACNAIANVIATPVQVAAALDTLGIVDFNPNH